MPPALIISWIRVQDSTDMTHQVHGICSWVDHAKLPNYGDDDL